MVRLGAFSYCRRPPLLRDLGIILRQAQEFSTLNQRLGADDVERAMVVDCNRIVGSSRKIQHLYGRIDAVTNNSASVLVAGESGTGKELVARAIYRRGVRADRPFITVPCGAIP